MANVPSGDDPSSRTEQVEITPEAVRDLSAEDKKGVANEVLRTLPAGATEVRKDVAREALESLSAQDQMTVAGSLLQGPTQQVSNTIWLIVIWAFSIVFVLAAFMLFVSVYMGLDDTQIVLTVFTTVTGVLAGFISGRASARGPTG